MGKLITYVLILSAIVLLFNLGGIIPEGSTISKLLTILLHPSDMKISTFFSEILTLKNLIIGATTAVIIGAAVVGGNAEVALKVGIVYFLVELGWAFVGIIQIIEGYLGVFAVVVISPLLFVYVLTCVNWMFGRD